MLIDGAKLYGACPNRIDAAAFHVDFAEIDTISIQKGPFDVKNPGSLAGVIDIHTLTPRKGFHADLNLRTGSYEDVSAGLNASYGGEKADLFLGYAFKYALPYRDGNGDRITDQYPDTSPNRYLDNEIGNKAYEIETIWTKLGFNPTANQRIELSFSRQNADDVIYPYLLMDADYDDTDRVNLAYEADNFLGPLEKLTFQIYWNQVEHLMTDNKRGTSIGWPIGYMMKTYAETRTYGGKAAVEVNLLEGILSLGADYFLRNWDTETTLPTGLQPSVPDVDLENVGAFLEYTRSVSENVLLAVGMRFDHVKTEAKINRSEVYEQYHSSGDRDMTDSYGSGNVQISYEPSDHLEFFGGFGLSVRSPDPVERYFALIKPSVKPNWVGNPGLDPTRNREFDAGVRFSYGLFSGRATVFYSDVEDYITIYQAPAINGGKDAKSYRNVDAAIYGGEFSFNLAFTKTTSLRGGFSYTRGEDETFDKPLLEIPPLEGWGALSYQRESFYFEVEGLWADDQDRVDKELNEASTSGWGIMNLRGGLLFNDFEIYAGVQNVFDKQYVEHLSHQRDPFRSGIKVPEIGRSFFIGMSVSFF